MTLSDEPTRSAGLGPAWLLLPVLSLAVGVVWVRHVREARFGEHPDPPPAANEREIAGWVGDADRPGGRLSARLVPLHDEAERDAFDRDALAARLGFDGGRPWRLQLTWVSGGEVESVEGLDPATLVVVHEDGRLAPAVAAPPRPAPDAVADPLAALLAPPEELLAPGTELTLVLWGAPPRGAVRLEGWGEPFALEARSLAADRIPRTLARLDVRPDVGTEAGPEAGKDRR